MNTRTRTTLAGLTLAALLTPLAACSSDDGDSDGSKQPDPSVQTGPTATPPVSASPGAQVKPKKIVTVIDEFAKNAGTAEFTLHQDSPQGSLELRGDVDYSGKNTEFAGVNTLTGDPINVVVAGGKTYAEASTGKWNVVGRKDTGHPAYGTDRAVSLQTLVKMLRDSLTGATYVGTEVVDGASMTHFELTTNLKQGKKAAAWFDADGMLRKYESVTGPITMTIDYDDWGKQVDITAPPKKQIAKAD